MLTGAHEGQPITGVLAGTHEGQPITDDVLAGTHEGQSSTDDVLLGTKHYDKPNNLDIISFDKHNVLYITDFDKCIIHYLNTVKGTGKPMCNIFSTQRKVHVILHVTLFEQNQSYR